MQFQRCRDIHSPPRCGSQWWVNTPPPKCCAYHQLLAASRCHWRGSSPPTFGLRVQVFFTHPGWGVLPWLRAGWLWAVCCWVMAIPKYHHLRSTPYLGLPGWSSSTGAGPSGVWGGLWGVLLLGRRVAPPAISPGRSLEAPCPPTEASEHFLVCVPPWCGARFPTPHNPPWPERWAGLVRASRGTPGAGWGASQGPLGHPGTMAMAGKAPAGTITVVRLPPLCTQCPRHWMHPFA